MFTKKRRRSRKLREEKVIDFESAREARKQKRAAIFEKKNSKKTKAKAEISERKQTKRNRKRMVYACVILCIAAIIGISLYNVAKLHKEYTEVLAEKEALEKEKERLTQELNNVNDPEYIDQQARKQLKMIKPGEIMYILPQNVEETTEEAIEMEESER